MSSRVHSAAVEAGRLALQVHWQPLVAEVILLEVIEVLRTPGHCTSTIYTHVSSCKRRVQLHSRIPTGQGKLEKVRELEWSGKVRERSGEYIFSLKSQGKVRENEKLVPPDVRF